MNRRLSALIEPIPRYARATNLERDSGQREVAEYHLIEPSLETLRRLSRTDTPAMVVTGPYGSGKSTFALFLDALLGPAGDPVTAAALANLATTDGALAATFGSFRDRLWADGEPVRAITTGRPEPMADAVLRALTNGAMRHAGLSRELKARLERAAKAPAKVDLVAQLFRDARAQAAIALIIDELGVVLDAAADAADDGLWLLQDLAEAVLGGRERRGFVLALQHRSLAEQLSGGREPPLGWRKVQGRFEEIAFVESREAVFSLIPRVLHRQADSDLESAVAAWARHSTAQASELGLEPFLPREQPVLGACYPLHPTVLLVLPDLTSYYGQRERTLLAFLAGGEPHSVRSFLESHQADERPLPSIDLPYLYEFFVASGSHRLGPAGRVSRWAEVERRIREAGELLDVESRLLRSIALLNLVARGGPARASGAMLEFAVQGAQEALPALITSGLLTYRSVTDEYRIWEGSDVDLDAALAASLAAVHNKPTAEILAELTPLPPVMASAHSERTGVVRTFERLYLNSTFSFNDHSDGFVIYDVDGSPLLPEAWPDKPWLLLKPSDTSHLRLAVLEAAALRRLLDDEAISRDWVARRELGERYAIAIDALRGVLDTTFAPAAVRVTLGLDGGREELPPDLLSRLASNAADRAFPETPEIRNEMFAVDELTSQGARARSVLFAAMIEHAGEPDLAFSGWGPERAMYAAIFGAGQLHQSGVHPYGPRPGSRFERVWQTLRTAMLGATPESITVEDVLHTVEDRPFGLRRSLTPLIWLAVVLAEADQLAIFERGTFLPVISADAVDRMVKSPSAFAVRSFAARGARARFLTAVDAALGLGCKKPTVVSVVSRLVQRLRRLPDYSLRTEDGIGETSRAVRAAILTAREPDTLLFEALPAALGHGPISPEGEIAADIADGLAIAVQDLESAYRRLLYDLQVTLARAFDLAPGDDLRTVLAARAEPLLGHTAEPGMRGFLQRAIDRSMADDEWLAAMVIAVGARPLEKWSDDDSRLFGVMLRELSGTYRRLHSLYAEAQTRGSTDGFEARRVTVTRSDGRETTRVIWLNASARSPIEAILDKTVDETERLVGADAVRILIAQLTERLEAEEALDEEVGRAERRPA